jgi:hypothetical protein
MRAWLKRFFNGSNAPVIVVSGLPRSGTSLMMQMLAAGGIPPLTDGKRRADASNPRGYFEYEPVKRLHTETPTWLESAQGRAVKIVSPLLGYLPMDYPYRIIFMERDLGEIAASGRAMTPGAPLRDTQADNARHLATIKAWLAAQAHIDVLYVAHRTAIDSPDVVAAQVRMFLGAELDVEAMAAVVDPSLYRARRD